MKEQTSINERNSVTIGEYLLSKLQEYNIKHVFGIPGDYVLRFYHLLEQSPIEHIGMTREDSAGYAADAYAARREQYEFLVTSLRFTRWEAE